MRLSTHNFLTSNREGVKEGYPLQLHVDQLRYTPEKYSQELVLTLLTRMDWPALKAGWESVRLCLDSLTTEDEEADLPKVQADLANFQLAESAETQAEDSLPLLHTLLLEVSVRTGRLVCPETAHEYEIKNGIPNMI